MSWRKGGDEDVDPNKVRNDDGIETCAFSSREFDAWRVLSALANKSDCKLEHIAPMKPCKPKRLRYGAHA